LDLRVLAGNILSRNIPQKRELEYASRQLTSIEVDGTFTARKKRKPSPNGETPDGFVFSLKAPRFACAFASVTSF
jgi:uncharacterized protein YecE (DUF72 family)